MQRAVVGGVTAPAPMVDQTARWLLETRDFSWRELTEDELMAWALPTAANQFWMLDQPERATAFLRAIRGRLSSAVTIDALLCTFAMNAGGPQRALEIAAAGGHNLLLIGPPGTGKTMLASRLTGLLPPLTEPEALESLAADHDYLLAGDVFTRDQLEGLMALKWEEVYAFEHTPHPIEYAMYYSC